MELLPRIITYTLEFLPERYVQERLHQYLEIEPPRAVLQIEQVVAQATKHLLQRVRIAVIERGVRGHTRTDLVQVTIAGITFHDLVDVELSFRTGADKRHITDENIPQLGQLIQMMLTQELAHTGHAGIRTSLVKGRTKLLSVQTHATELINVERATETTDTLLLENGRTAILAPYGDVTDQEQRENTTKAIKAKRQSPIRFTLRSKAFIPSEIKSVDFPKLSSKIMAS